MDSNDGIVYVQNLSGYEFVVPSYQRGYRWEPAQIRALLDDVFDFNDSNGAKYCLQPIVIKPMASEKQYEVIDGQQRLTTIYIILKYAYQCIVAGGNPPFIISYQSREHSKLFLEEQIGTVSFEECDNPDMYFMQLAWETVGAWKDERNLTPMTFLKDVIGKLEESVMLIWYEIDKDQDPISMFRKLNVGKIPLTNAELVKALIFSTLRSDPKRKSLSEISAEWDRMEQRLHDDDLWYFLTNEGNSQVSETTRIDLIINTWAAKKEKGLPINSKDPYYAFLVVSDTVKSASDRVAAARGIWDAFLDIFSDFQYWYENNDLYHQIGYLIASGKNDATSLFIDLVEKDKSEVESLLFERITDSLRGMRRKDQIRGLDYNSPKSKEKIRNLLLLFNIRTIMDTDGSNTRFPFSLYKSQQWDLEHIHATAAEPPLDSALGGHEKGIAARKAYFELLIEVANDLAGEIEISETSIDEVKLFVASGSHSDEAESLDFLNTKLGTLLEEISAAQNSISNLTLLDSGTNRGYGNESFVEKRNKIIERDRSAVFIPPCTKNVFLKYYTYRPENFAIWEKQDREEYIEGQFGLINTLSRYLESDCDE